MAAVLVEAVDEKHRTHGDDVEDEPGLVDGRDVGAVEQTFADGCILFPFDMHMIGFSPNPYINLVRIG